MISSVQRAARWVRPLEHTGVHTVVMIRHGESLWNLENRFTGWCDVPLTKSGRADAFDAGRLMGTRGLHFDVAFTSKLERAWRTCALALSASGQMDVETIRSSKLNERHYGALQGHHKDCPSLVSAFGEDQVMEWRRSFHSAPPSLYNLDFHKKLHTQDRARDGLVVSTQDMDPSFIDQKLFNYTREQLSLELAKVHGEPIANKVPASASRAAAATAWPSTESLQECQQRAYGYWNDVIAPRVLSGDRVLIVAHANTIRALVKAIDGIDDAAIAKLKIPNGVPLVYTMDDNLNVVKDISDDIGFQAKYLVSSHNHSRMMRYENSMRKKLRSLFEYLDVDNDGRITPECLRAGLTRLQNIAAVSETYEKADMAAPASSRSNRMMLNLQQTSAIVGGAGSAAVANASRHYSTAGGEEAAEEYEHNFHNMSSISSAASSSVILEAHGNTTSNNTNINNSSSRGRMQVVRGAKLSEIEAEGEGDASRGMDENELDMQRMSDTAAAEAGNGAVYNLDTAGTSWIQPDLGKVCEYEVEELLRCVPDADEDGGVTLEAFLAAESSLVVGLTQFKLLQ